MRNAFEWKAFYADERAALGDSGLDAMIERAATLTLPKRGAWVFPHTRLRASGKMPAAVAKAIAASGAEEVLAIGVLHGARRQDAERVARARAGDPSAVAALRGVHGDGAPFDAGIAAEEFSLDGFLALLTRAFRGRPAPRLHTRFPFLAGASPHDLPGLDELARLIESGIPVVATMDAIHHGHGYATPPDSIRARTEPTTIAWAHTRITQGLDLLCAAQFDAFLAHATQDRSDFRDTGPTLIAALQSTAPIAITATTHAPTLVDYADALQAPAPTWVAATLALIEAISPRAAQ